MKIKNSYFEGLATKDIQPLLAKEFTAKTSYWLARLFDRLEQEAGHYFRQKQKLIDKYAKRYEEAGEERLDGKTIKSWEKGDMISDGQTISLKDPEAFSKELNEIIEIEIDLKLDKIQIDLEKEPSLTIDEMLILLPFIEIKEE